MKNITLSDLEIATAVAALRTVAAEKHTQDDQREALERLAQKLQEPVGESCSHNETRYSHSLGNYCADCKKQLL